MRRILLLLCALLLLLLSACAQPAPVEEGDFLLYFPSSSYLQESALAAQPFDLPEDIPPETALLEALLAGPTREDLLSPFPTGVTLRSWQVEDGILSVTLSEQYGGLSGMALTLADYSITLTLCQLEHIDGISITAENDPMPFRYRQLLTPEDLIPSALPSSGAAS